MFLDGIPVSDHQNDGPRRPKRTNTSDPTKGRNMGSEAKLHRHGVVRQAYVRLLTDIAEARQPTMASKGREPKRMFLDRRLIGRDNQ